jgi:hypothetical protein
MKEMFGAVGLIEITSNEGFGLGDVWDSSGTTANAVAASISATFPGLFIKYTPTPL